MIDHHTDAALPGRRGAFAPHRLHLGGVAGRCVDKDEFFDQFVILRREPLRDEATERNAANMRFLERLRADDFRQLFCKIRD
jgi:hypothetical protein